MKKEEERKEPLLPEITIERDKLSPNYGSRKKGISLMVIHWTASSFRSAYRWMIDPSSKVSAHYLISKKGKILQLVDEENKAWHCGKSFLEGYGDNLNSVSIGIELEGPPSMIKEKEWSVEQIEACVGLCKDIHKRYPTIRITDHSSIAPGRKQDVKMGEGIDKFDWETFVDKTGIEEV